MTTPQKIMLAGGLALAAVIAAYLTGIPAVQQWGARLLLLVAAGLVGYYLYSLNR